MLRIMATLQRNTVHRVPVSSMNQNNAGARVLSVIRGKLPHEE